MRKYLSLLLAVFMLVLTACSPKSEEAFNVFEKQTGEHTKTDQETMSPEETQSPATSQPANTSGTEATTGANSTTGTTQATTKPAGSEATEQTTKPTSPPENPTHSPMYLSGVETDSVIRWFNEVVLDAEFVNSGNATLVQKWNSSIAYALIGEPTEADRAVVSNMVFAMNGISGFPGMYEVSGPASANFNIYFVSQEEMIEILGDNFYGCDGGVTIWWDGAQQIYKGTICIRTDLDQYVRNSVIMEEIYNGLGPVQDTDLRSDSLIYSGYSTPQQMTQVDVLIMKLLYNSKIRCGMSAAECEKVIRELYY